MKRTPKKKKKSTEEKVEGIKCKIHKAGRRRESAVCNMTYIWSRDTVVQGGKYGSHY